MVNYVLFASVVLCTRSKCDAFSKRFCWEVTVQPFFSPADNLCDKCDLPHKFAVIESSSTINKRKHNVCTLFARCMYLQMLVVYTGPLNLVYK